MLNICGLVTGGSGPSPACNHGDSTNILFLVCEGAEGRGQGAQFVSDAGHPDFFFLSSFLSSNMPAVATDYIVSVTPQLPATCAGAEQL